MLGHCTTHKEYLQFVLGELRTLALTRPDQIREYEDAISRMVIQQP